MRTRATTAREQNGIILVNKALNVILFDGFISSNPGNQLLLTISPFKRLLLLFVSFVPVLCVNVALFWIHHSDSLMEKVAPVPFASTVIVLLNDVGVG